MKKIILLAVLAVTVVSCEREVENVVKDEKTFENFIVTKHEKNSSKPVSDSIQVKNLSPDAGTKTFGPVGPVSEIDPGDIVPPRR